MSEGIIMSADDKQSEQKSKSESKAGSESKDLTPAEREAWTQEVIKKYAYGSMAVALIPLPLVDLVALTGIQIKLIDRLATFYGVPFSRERTKNIIASLAGASVPLGLTRAVGSILKVVPLIGLSAAVVFQSGLSAASTYALGMIFVRHFELGGTFLTFDTKNAKSDYDEQIEKGKAVAEELKRTAG
jgi:uncharacterized protein (DUF697 family)